MSFKKFSTDKMPIRYAIYARYSSDKQNPKSCEDQITACNEYINRKNDGIVVGTYFDEGVSGAVNDRSGLNQVSEMAQNEEFDVLVVESQDRISRSQSYMANFHEKFEFSGITILSLQEQEIDSTKATICGVISSQYLKSLSAKTKRGHHSAISRGVLPLKPIFGYVKNADKTWSVDPDQAQIIKRIFDMFLEGFSCKEIADILTEEQAIPYTKHSKKWTNKYCKLVLKRQLYCGIFLWGQQKRAINPYTDKKVIKPARADKILTHQLPQLEIIPKKTFDTVQGMLKRGPKLTKQDSYYALHQTVHCHTCDSQMHIWKSQKKKQSYIHFVCPARDRSNITCCDGKNSVALYYLTKLVFQYILEYIKDNSTKTEQQIAGFCKDDSKEFQNFKMDVFKAVSFGKMQEMMNGHKSNKTIDVSKIIRKLENAINTHNIDPQNKDAVEILQWFIKKVSVKRTAPNNTKAFEFTYEIDWLTIAKNLKYLQ